MRTKIFLIAQTIFPATVLTFANVAYAQSTTLCGGDDSLAKLFCATDLSSTLNAAFQLSILLGAVLAMLRIGFAGWLYMGSDIWSNKQSAVKIFQDAIIGLLILLAIYMILFQINPDILSLKIQGVTN